MPILEDSIWIEYKSKEAYPKKSDTPFDVDVAIIGGGIAGISTAYLLSKTKLKVALFEKYKVGLGTSAYTTAMITQYTDSGLADLPKIYGVKRAKQIWQSHGEAIDLIEKIVKKEKLDCEFTRVPYFIYANKDSEKDALMTEQKAAAKLGVNLEFNNDKLVLKAQAKFHPVKYITQLAKVAAKNGVQIYEDSEVKSLAEINAKQIIIATHKPFNTPLEFKFKQARYKTYMIYAKIAAGTMPEGLYQDTNNPYHYFRIDKHKFYDTILIGGEDHRADLPVNPHKCYQALEKYLGYILDTKYDILARWDGPIYETIDGLGYIGAIHGNNKVLYATGFSGNGMTYATLSAEILSDYVQGKKNKYSDLYSAKRIPNVNQLSYKFKDYMQIFFGGAVKNFFNG